MRRALADRARNTSTATAHWPETGELNAASCRSITGCAIPGTGSGTGSIKCRLNAVEVSVAIRRWLSMLARLGPLQGPLAVVTRVTGSPAFERGLLGWLGRPFVRSRYGVLLKSNWPDSTFDMCYFGRYGRTLSDLLREEARPFVFLDIGANQGLYALLAGQIAIVAPHLPSSRYRRPLRCWKRISRLTGSARSCDLSTVPSRRRWERRRSGRTRDIAAALPWPRATRWRVRRSSSIRSTMTASML